MNVKKNEITNAANNLMEHARRMRSNCSQNHFEMIFFFFFVFTEMIFDLSSPTGPDRTKTTANTPHIHTQSARITPSSSSVYSNNYYYRYYHYLLLPGKWVSTLLKFIVRRYEINENNQIFSRTYTHTRTKRKQEYIRIQFHVKHSLIWLPFSIFNVCQWIALTRYNEWRSGNCCRVDSSSRV